MLWNRWRLHLRRCWALLLLLLRLETRKSLLWQGWLQLRVPVSLRLTLSHLVSLLRWMLLWESLLLTLNCRAHSLLRRRLLSESLRLTRRLLVKLSLRRLTRRGLSIRLLIHVDVTLLPLLLLHLRLLKICKSLMSLL